MNLWSCALCVRHFTDALSAAGGSVVLLSDIWARRPLARHTAYSVSKAGVEALIGSVARELAPEVRVNAVAPGIVTPTSVTESVVDRIPAGRLCTADEVAAAIEFLLFSPRVLTGSVVTVDGGRSLV